MAAPLFIGLLTGATLQLYALFSGTSVSTRGSETRCERCVPCMSSIYAGNGVVCIAPATTRRMLGNLTRSPMQDGRVPVHLAAKKGRTAIVEFLLRDQRVNPADKDNVGSNRDVMNATQKKIRPVACTRRTTATYVSLLPCNAAMQRGWTTLHRAAKKGHTAVVERLLQDPRVDPAEKDNVRRGGK